MREEVAGAKKGWTRGRAGGDVYVKQKRGLFCKGEVFFLLTCPLMGDPFTNKRSEFAVSSDWLGKLIDIIVFINKNKGNS
jgi:hypothetical protein